MRTAFAIAMVFLLPILSGKMELGMKAQTPPTV
jgi:hypothetical protein